ncbi:hypothetical protein [Caulobacter sp. NIBR1757]|uniref:hypothetical protein n=1 Tax=Caulobacter sp. NIBR1757 TaxID=3016000 RepID=UPI0022F0270A|nr:hypothetical protein [Caulobacter sp. NIBR1757]
MHRRAFIAGSALAAAAAPLAGKAVAATAETVTIKGYLKRITTHYYAISPTAQKTDPSTTDYAAWPSDVVRVYPRDARKMTLGLVSVKGVVLRGRQQDAFTRTVATVVMTDAVMA